jgi:hypothetical protein
VMQDIQETLQLDAGRFSNVLFKMTVLITWFVLLEFAHVSYLIILYIYVIIKVINTIRYNYANVLKNVFFFPI